MQRSLLYLLTVSMSLSRSDWTVAFVQNQLILGVMGVDVHLDELKRLAPRYNVSFRLTELSHFLL